MSDSTSSDTAERAAEARESGRGSATGAAEGNDGGRTITGANMTLREYLAKQATKVGEGLPDRGADETQSPMVRRKAEVEEHEMIQHLSLERLDRDLFRSIKLITPSKARGTYGGQLIAHAMAAAELTVDDKAKRVHSLHSNFVAPGDSSIPMYYRVNRLRDGKSYASRFVEAFQKGQAVYVATVSFHRPEEPGLQHTQPMPDAPPPEKAVAQVDLMSRLIDAAPTQQLRENLARKTAPSLMVRYCRVPDAKRGEPQLRTTQPMVSWMRAVHMPPDPVLHRRIAFFMTDFTLALSPLFPHGFPNPALHMMVSLDHTIYFHSDFAVDDWCLYQVQSSWADNNRGLCHGKVFTRDGKLRMTVFQETLVRMKPGFTSIAKL